MDHSATTEAGESHGSLASYLTGFTLSVILTAGAFALVMTGALAGSSAIIAVAALAVVQILVHLFCFLHLNGASEQRWNVSAFVFTVVVVAILVGGTLWVMYNANINMMPQMGMMPR
jgi:cytochrome o ubiquinol oxidase operon protein cyoD